MEPWTSSEMMTVSAARLIPDRTICFVGIGLPSEAANLARRRHAPGAILVYESGTIGAKPQRLPLSIGDGDLAETADTVVPLAEIFNYWLQPGRIQLGFLGAAQIDRFANLNTTVIGSYGAPTVRLPGAGGAPAIAAYCQQTVVVLPQSKRSFVEQLDFVTSPGFLTGGRAREEAGLRTRGPVAVVTDMGILRPDPETRELTLESVHPGIEVEQARSATGWALAVAEDVTETPRPTPDELAALRTFRVAGDSARVRVG